MTARPAAPIITARVFVFAFLAASAFALTSRYRGYVHHDTAEIAMWSQLGWPMGLPKHPPLLPWLFRLTSYAVPLNWVTLSLLTAANIVAGAWAVWRIGVVTRGEQRAAVGLMLYGLAPAATFFALKLNHNAILVSLWPLTILAFLLCLRAETTARSVAWGAVFGVLAAAAMLAKYYSGVLLACCFAASLVSARRLRFYTMPGGYIAVAVFAVLMAPHVGWMWDNRGATLDYALHESEREAHPLAHFLLVAPTYILPTVAAFFAGRWWIGQDSAPAAGSGLGDGASCERELWVLALGPFVLTAVFIAVFKLRGATSWSLPDFCIVPVVLAGLLPDLGRDQLASLLRVAARGLWLIALAGPVVLLAAFALGDSNAVEPRSEVADAAGLIFKAATGREVAIVAGDPQSANAAALDIASKPTALTNFNWAFAPWITPQDVNRSGLLIICRPGYGGCAQGAEAFAAGRHGVMCSVSRHRRLLGLTGKTMTAQIWVIAPEATRVDDATGLASCQAGGDGARFVRLILP